MPFGTKDFSTLDRNAALVNRVLESRLQYEAERAKTEKTRFNTEEAAREFNNFADVFKATHTEEQWIPGDTPGTYKRETVERPGPDRGELFNKYSETMAKLNRYGDQGKQAQDRVDHLMTQWNANVQQIPKPPKATSGGMKSGQYTGRAVFTDEGVKWIVQNKETGEVETKELGELPADWRSFATTAGNRRVVFEYDQNTSQYKLVDLGEAPETGKTKGGFGSGATEIEVPYTYINPAGAIETKKVTGNSDEDVLNQYDTLKAQIEQQLEGTTGLAAAVEEDYMENNFTPEELATFKKDGDGRYIVSINLDDYIAPDTEEGKKRRNLADKTLMAMAKALEAGAVEESKTNAQVVWALKNMAATKGLINQWRSIVATERKLRGMKKTALTPPGTPGAPSPKPEVSGTGPSGIPLAGTAPAPAAKPAASGKIKVRRKSDGKVGSISEKFFDPNKYEKIAQ